MDAPDKPKRLYRSRRYRMFGGVCGGLAEYFSTDPTWIRLIAILLFFLGFGIIFIIYLIMWLIVPEAPHDEGCSRPDCPK